jgi:hypothetical protein
MQEAQGDTRFVPEVWSTPKVVYISIEELIKSWVSFNPNPPKFPPRPTRCSLSILTKRRAIQTSRTHHTPWELPGDTQTQRGHWGRGWGALAWRWHTQGSSNLLSRTRIKIGVLEREERAQALDLKKVFCVSEWPTAQGSRWGSISSPHFKKSRWGAFHRTSLMDLSESRCKASRSWPYTGQVWSHHRTSSVGISGNWWEASAGRSSDRTSLADHTSPVGFSGVCSRVSGSRWFTGQVRWNQEIWFLDR